MTIFIFCHISYFVRAVTLRETEISGNIIIKEINYHLAIQQYSLLELVYMHTFLIQINDLHNKY